MRMVWFCFSLIKQMLIQHSSQFRELESTYPVISPRLIGILHILSSSMVLTGWWRHSGYPEHSSVLPAHTFVLTSSPYTGDSFGGGPESILINHAIIYRWTRNLVSAYLGGCGDNWGYRRCSYWFPASWRRSQHCGRDHRLKEMARTGQAGTGAVLQSRHC
jgi:hypothetical protein